ncbi:MAG: hypothetical protein ACM31C_30795, partial [Acidobacteriota bacterium]
ATGGNLLVPTAVLVGPTGSAQLTGADEVGQGIDFGCARLGTDVWCWGENTLGQLGDGTIGAGQPWATRVTGLPPVVQIGVAAYTTCALDTSNQVWCWGDGTHGELADGRTMVTAPSPVRAQLACP